MVTFSIFRAVKLGALTLEDVPFLVHAEVTPGSRGTWHEPPYSPEVEIQDVVLDCPEMPLEAGSRPWTAEERAEAERQAWAYAEAAEEVEEKAILAAEEDEDDSIDEP